MTMTDFVAVMLGLLLVIILVGGEVIVVQRKRRLLSPKDRYRREMRGLLISNYLRNEPRPARQVGADALGTQHISGGWMA